MKDCQELRTILFRIAEGEGSPDEAMRCARHLPDCTACRILLARERRLAEMLEDRLTDPLSVGEEFVESVMAKLPSEPPPTPRRGQREQREQRRRRGRRRSIKLAGFAAILGLLPLALRGFFVEWGTPFAGIYRPDIPGAEGTMETWTVPSQWFLSAVGTIALELPNMLRGLSHSMTLGALGLVPLAAFFVVAAMLAIATRGVFKLASC